MKKLKEKTILSRCKSATHFSDNRWRWGDICKALKEEKIELQDTDILEVGYTEGWDEGDSARDPMYDLKVIRLREETDEEYERRISFDKLREERQKHSKYQKYLELKKEFENSSINKCTCDQCTGLNLESSYED